MRRHMVTYEHTTWRRVGVHAFVCMCVFAHVCVRVMREIKLSFQDNAISL